ncbi:glycosyltransferase [Scytonema hofmannii FACHB-248]|uniref:Glycosyltransferase n=2 Tax=Cyanophyceae TaxID=3028117 RepID=A0ABR8GN57_9CYAN|nr:glycosyltransferase [Scytonema hofmannii FACHB-248]
MIPDNNKKINFQREWIVFKKEGLRGYLQKVITKIKPNLNKSQYGVINNLENIQKYTVIDTPKKIKFNFPNCPNPQVSVIIPVYNKFTYTFNCLISLQSQLSNSINFEIIVVDDNSSDETQEYLSYSSTIQLLVNEQNLGFIRSCNRGAARAKGEFLCFLNNDTQVLPGWLENLVEVITQDNEVGAVGSKLIYPDGRLQEAGGIIWQDASGWNYGRLEHPDQPEYNYVRQVDYCSAASLLVRTEIFNNLGGFSEEFIPAYYEDTDLCFAIRQLGYKVIYQPKSQLIHYEGISSGTSLETGVKSYQKVNRYKFLLKWQEQLKRHLTPKAENAELAARRLQGNKTILIIDTYVPLHDQESGSYRLYNIIKIFLTLGYFVIFLPDNGLPQEPYTSEFQNLGIEVLYCTYQQPSLQDQLIKRLELIDIAWVCRPDLCSKYINIIRINPKISVIYDTVDLHFLRLQRQQELIPPESNNNPSLPSWRKVRDMELNMARIANSTVVVTDVEKKILEDFHISNVLVVPNIHHQYEGELPDFEQRNGLLFIGGYNHTPNVDAVIWMCKEIMPLIWQEQPKIKITLLGSNPPAEVKDLASDRRIEVTGYIQDVEPYFLKSRVFVAPLRYGAGMKGKIGHSLSYGLPTVTTSIGAEGMGLTHEVNVLIADEVKDFVEAVLKVYNNHQLWSLLSQNSFKVINEYSPQAMKLILRQLLESIDSVR